MELWLVAVLCGVAAVSAVLPDPRASVTRYTGWRVLSVPSVSEEMLRTLMEMEDPDVLNIMQELDGGRFDVAVSPFYLDNVTALLSEAALVPSVRHEDLANLLDANDEKLRSDRPLAPGGVTFERYMDLKEIEAYVKKLPERYPELVSVRTVGQSTQGKPIYVVSVTKQSGKQKPVILVDGGAHAREWVSPATAMFLIERLLQSPELTSGLEWQVVPLLNPDGYEYSWTSDRLWRKNLAPTRSLFCPGVDLNRNYGFKWAVAGSSQRACSSVYHGPSAFSEPETRAMKAVMEGAKARAGAYVSIHSYGQFILFPWGYSADVDHPNHPKLDKAGKAMQKAIKEVTGVHYRVGTAARLLYSAAGGSDDYASSIGFPLSFTFEMRDEGEHGFVLPPQMIADSVLDGWAAFQSLGRTVLGTSQKAAADKPLEAEKEAARTKPAADPVEDSEEAEDRAVKDPLSILRHMAEQHKISLIERLQ